MIHFPSSLPRRSDSLQLNATQQKQPTHKIFLTVQEELHDARRVHSHGQEEDLRLALNMLIDRLSQLSTMLSDAYKTNADLEVQLNVAKSNLQLVISNNEMLEDALKRGDASARDVGWRRSSARSHTIDDAPSPSSPRVPGASTPTHSATPSGEFTAPDPHVSASAPASTQESSRFFKFRFTGSSPNPGSSTASASSSRPGTPSPALPHLGSPVVSSKEKEELEKELEKERAARKQAKKEKEQLEAELEALSQALFEEANKMVASERIRRADIEEELREATLEKEALRSALKLLEGENSHLRSASSSPAVPPPSTSTSDSTSTSAPPSSQDTLSPDHVDPDANARTPPSPPSTSSSPRTQHLPPSLSALPTRLPPPQPLAIPTTPFSWAEGDVPTPRWRAGRVAEEGEAEPELGAEDEKGTEMQAARVPPPPPPPLLLQQAEPHTPGGTGAAEPDTPPTPPPPPPEHEHEHRSSASTPLRLFAPHEHERDPWADAARVGAVQY
ncbi:putative GDP/GTP exchange factor Sec2p [Lyophyllum shimeji]|uniref:GDP/GTP exchange factor Sec2p n=1 Tax=Lyophyllum shimeji TaxID=47721 RepID=A0A9P3UTV0_LYOSH|nr:putative GDP/GTP exchange factor Sec2p [Lyophyllum shimeji]